MNMRKFCSSTSAIRQRPDDRLRLNYTLDNIGMKRLCPGEPVRIAHHQYIEVSLLKMPLQAKERVNISFQSCPDQFMPVDIASTVPWNAHNV